jgi:hypothetical protein
MANNLTKINKHRDDFNWVLARKEFRYTNKQISAWCGFDESKLSRFLSGKRDLSASEFFHLLQCMPQDFQERFWSRFNPVSLMPHLEDVVAKMDALTLANLVNLIGEELPKKMSNEQDSHQSHPSLLSV